MLTNRVELCNRYCNNHDPRNWRTHYFIILLGFQMYSLYMSLRHVRSGDKALHLLNLHTRRRWVVSFTPRPLYTRGQRLQYPFYSRLSEPQSWSEQPGEKKFLLLPDTVTICESSSTQPYSLYWLSYTGFVTINATNTTAVLWSPLARHTNCSTHSCHTTATQTLCYASA
jgi:hypothetical protein